MNNKQIVRQNFKTAFFIFLFIPSIYAQVNKVAFFQGDSLMGNLSGTWTSSNYIEIFNSEDVATPMSIYHFNTELSYYLYDGLAVSGNLHLMYPHGFRFNYPDEWEIRNTYGLGTAAFIRWDFVQLYKQNLFIEFGIGMVFTNRKFPPEGTKYNFTQRYGFGMNIYLSENFFLIAGLRHMHISNGKGFVRTNPQFNGNGIYLGVRFMK